MIVPERRKSQNPRIANFFPGKIPILINKISSYSYKTFAFLLFFAGTRVISLALPTATPLPINCSLCITHSHVVLVISNRISTLSPSRCKMSFSPPPTIFGNIFLCHPELSNTSYLSCSFLQNFSSCRCEKLFTSLPLLWHLLCDQQCKLYPGLKLLKLQN